jgi:homogentisate 1,2-dioxygenase
MWTYAGLRGRNMTHSELVRIEVQGADILVAMRGTCFRVKYRKQAAPWLSVQEYGPDDPDAMITLSEFRALAWAAANDKARELGWLA